MALETIVKLLAMFLQVIGEAKPFNSKHEHPVNRFLQRLMAAVILVDFTHALLAMAQVERLLLVHLHKGAFPGTKCRTLVDITEQDIAHAVIKRISYNQFHPTVQGDIKGIRIFELVGLAFKDQFFRVHP